MENVVNSIHAGNRGTDLIMSFNEGFISGGIFFMLGVAFAGFFGASSIGKFVKVSTHEITSGVFNMLNRRNL